MEFYEYPPNRPNIDSGAEFTPPPAPILERAQSQLPPLKDRIPPWARRKRFWLTSLIIIILAIVVVSRSGPEGQVAGGRIRSVEIQKIVPQDTLETQLVLKGTVTPREFTRVKSLVRARLQFLAPIGRDISKGQVIARLSDADTESAYGSALGSVSDAQNSLAETKALNEETLTQAQLAVNSALTSLEATRLLTRESLRQSQDSAEVAYARAYNTIEQVLSFWGGGTKTDFILKNTPNANKGLLNPTESEYFRLLDAFNSLATRASDDIDFNILAMEQALELSRNFNDRVFRVLSFSIPLLTGNFTQSTIDRYQSQAILFQTQINRDDQGIKSAKTNLRSSRVSTAADLEQAKIAYDNSLSSLESAEKQTEIRELAAKSQVNSATLQLSSSQDRFSELTLRSPFSGVVISHRANVGDQMAVGSDLLEIGQLSAVEIELLIDQDSAKLLDLEKQVLINGEVLGQITELAPAASFTTGKIAFTVAADNTDSALTGGDVAEVSVTLKIDKPGIIVVPLSTVTVSQTETYLYVAEENKVAKRIITLGDVLGSQVEITEGLSAGDQVILSNGELLSEGEEIEIHTN